MTARHKLNQTRRGTTTKIVCGAVSIYVTVNADSAGNAREMFIRADNGWQGWCDVLAETASLYLQRGGDLAELYRHWRGHRFAPDGIAGQGTSLPDAIAREGEYQKRGEALP